MYENKVERSCEMCHRHPDMRARRGAKVKTEGKPRAKHKRRKTIIDFFSYFLSPGNNWEKVTGFEGIPFFFQSLAKDIPEHDHGEKNRAWKELNRLNKYFSSYDQ